MLALVSPQLEGENNLSLAYEGSIALTKQSWPTTGTDMAERRSARAAASEQSLLNLAVILLHNADSAEAQDLLLRAVLIAPNDARIHERFGAALPACG